MLADIESLYQRYLAIESHGPRFKMLAALQNLIEALNQLEPHARWHWVRDYLTAYEAQSQTLPMRFPLLEQIILPLLLNAYQDHEPDTARWLALIYNLALNHPLWEQIGSPFKEQLLKTALKQNHQDDQARHMLLELLAREISFSLHELPIGVLNGMDGASIEACSDLSAQLKAFQALLNPDELKLYQSLISLAELHYREYPLYLAQSAWKTYPDYLNAKGLL